MVNQFDPGDLLRGAEQIALAIYGSKEPATVRKIYHEQKRWPIFRLDNSGMLYALRSRIAAHLASKSTEKEARMLAESSKPTAVKSSPKPKRRRTRAVKTAAAASTVAG